MTLALCSVTSGQQSSPAHSAQGQAPLPVCLLPRNVCATVLTPSPGSQLGSAPKAGVPSSTLGAVLQAGPPCAAGAQQALPPAC